MGLVISGGTFSWFSRRASSSAGRGDKGRGETGAGD